MIAIHISTKKTTPATINQMDEAHFMMIEMNPWETVPINQIILLRQLQMVVDEHL